jgi:hypothetical protein
MAIVLDYPRTGVSARDVADLNATLRAPQACARCGVAVAASTLQPHPQLGPACCTLCRETAHILVSRYDGAAARHRADFLAQLAGMVADHRAGVEEPTWYRGIDG